MDKNQLVEIFVPTRDGADSGQIGTGYPVAPDRILTARHVLFPASRDETRRIEVRWYHLLGEARQWRPIDRIVWDGGTESDAALIAVGFPAGVHPTALLSGNMPVTGAQWESEGFARAGKKSDRRDPVGLKGQLYAMADTARTFELGVDDTTSLTDGWKGVSGSPVFVSHALLGVVVTCPQNFDNRRLHATPCWRVLVDERFRSELGIDAKVARLEAYRTTIADKLRRAAAVVDSLAEKLKDPALQAGDEQQRPARVAESLTRLLPQHALELLDGLHCEYWDEGDLQNARLVKDVAFLVLPAVFDEGVVEGVRKWDAGRQGALIDVPIGTRTIAELVMAGFDRRSLQYRRSVEGQELDGQLRLPHVAEEGIDRDCRKFQEAFGAHLNQHLLAGDFQTLYDAFHDYLTSLPDLVSDTQRRRGLSRETLDQLAAGKLRYKRNRKQTHYFVFEFPADTPLDVRERFRVVLAQLKQQYDAIVFLSLSRDGRLIVREHEDLVYSLSELHKREPPTEGRP
jgi:hypothetical protein